MGNKSSRDKMAPADMDDLLQNTMFTQEEIKSWYKNFIKEFPGGRVNVHQFQNLYAQYFPNGDAVEFAQHVFRTFDKDSDDRLDFREFMMALNITARGGANERLKWAFQMYDVDNNGSITKEECVQIIKAITRLQMQKDKALEVEIAKIANERSDKIFKTMDKNNDGTLNMEEFIEGAKMDESLIKLI